MPEWSVFNQRHVEIAEARPAKGVAAQRSEVALVWTRASGKIDGNREERTVVRALPEIILAYRAARREIGHRNQVRPVRSARTNASLLDAGIHCERRSAGHRRNIQKLPSRRNSISQRLQKAHPIEWQRLDQAQRERVSHVKRRGTFVGLGIKRILWQRLQDYAGICRQTAEDCAGVVNRFPKCITRLQAQADSRVSFIEARLQRVIAGVRTRGHNRLRPKTSDRVPRGIELCKRSELRSGAGIAIWRKHACEVNARRAYISGAKFYAVKIMVDACRPRTDISIAEIARDASGVEQLDFMPGRHRCQIILKTLQVNGCVGRHLGAVAAGKKRLALRVVNGWKRYGRNRIAERHRHIRQRGDQRLENQWKRAGNEIVLPQVGEDRGNRSASVQSRVRGQRIADGNTRAPAIRIQWIHGLRIVKIDLRCAWSNEGGRRFTV